MRNFTLFFLALLMPFLSCSNNNNDGAAEQELPAITGMLVVVNKGSDNAHIIDLSNPQNKTIIETGKEPHEIDISPDGKTAVVTDYGGQTPGSTLTVIDLVNKARVKTINLGQYRAPHGIDYLDNDRVLVTVEANKSLLQVNVSTGEIEKTMRTNQDVSHMVVTDQDNRAYVSNISSGNLTAFDLGTGEVLAHITTGSGAEGLDVSPDGKSLWVGNRAADNISVIDTEALEVINTLETGAFPIRAKFTTDGSKVLVTNAREGSISVFDAEDKKLVGTIQLDIDVTVRLSPIGILVHPTEPYAFVANTTEDEVIVIDLNEMREAGSISTDHIPDGMAIAL